MEVKGGQTIQWRTDNTMENRKRTNNDLQSTTQKTKKRLKIPKGGNQNL